MTTIAIRDGVLAFDARVTEADAGILSEVVQKAWINLKHQCIIAIAGNVPATINGVKAMERGLHLPFDEPPGDLPRITDDSCIIVLTKAGRVFTITFDGWYESEGPFWAFGSGSPAARAAMHMGADAKKAVEIAILCDSASGPPVRWFDIRNIPPKRRRK